MSAAVISVLDLVSRRLHDPRRWVQGTWEGIRRERGHGVLPFYTYGDSSRSNCWCLGQAITIAVNEVLPRAGEVAWTELRSDVERELLCDLQEATGDSWPAVYMWNDAPQTSFRDVQALVAGTYCRLLAEQQGRAA